MYKREKVEVSQQQDLYEGGELWLPWRWLRNGALFYFQFDFIFVPPEDAVPSHTRECQCHT